jgi:3-oxoacyl-[acyl-carrier protein] reductase
MDTQLQGKVVLITGASGGIGSSIARKFASEGARVLVHYHHGRARAIALQRELGLESAIVRADLTQEGQVRALFREAARRWGRIDTLVANAGSWVSRDRLLHRIGLRQWRQTLDSVLTSTFLTLREFMRLVFRQKRGNAVMIASTAAVFGEAGHAYYAASKAAIAYGLTRSLKNELARLAPHTRQYCGGRINCICPGWTLVPRTASQLREAATLKKVAATMALPQIARPDDIANAAVFLSSDILARHITGQTVVVAGGMEGRLLWQPQEIDLASV